MKIDGVVPCIFNIFISYSLTRCYYNVSSIKNSYNIILYISPPVKRICLIPLKFINTINFIFNYNMFPLLKFLNSYSQVFNSTEIFIVIQSYSIGTLFVLKFQ